MPKVVVFSSISAARTFCQRVNTALGLPKPGTNALDGSVTPAGIPGWTIAHYAPIRVVDTNGVYGTANTVYFLVGPIGAAMEARLLAMSNPPTIVQVPAAILRKGRRYRPVISSWASNAPVAGEAQEDFDETVP